ncbi:LysR family transcriptional regulator [Rhizobium leguminosarum]|uniref:HTH-type transcriptional regulator TtuA n=2 Tax=Rhizobium TaxID=379 RepID=A0A179BGH1_RHILE|nr:LysR family transcriptional regulator [Rhizobium leguminosarum]MBY5364124.1 LysR family transcriptional regulator [Rhizobium leguminosarum]MBY5409476.1 LysR family transcriptional regulator [Rhizobium leguminosarum]MBY5438483.1 LysR family transcriptional regulator [Rhizobium leguminosarum]OAP90817.1 LysR family transcriptional regulator [Rhizobium leguminosarum]
MDTLTRIRAFIDVVEAEGFSAAARRTGRSKALLSKYVRELEDELGALLLNRTTRQFSMTEAGHTYYRTASDILKEIDNLADLVRENNAQLKGRLRISVPRTFVDADVGQSLIDFAKENPDLSLEIAADDRFVDLIEESFDVAIRITKLEDSGMIARKISDFRIHICATPDFLERYPDLDHPTALSNVPFIVDTNARTQASIRFHNPDNTSFAVAVSGPIEVNSPHATLRAALAGIGVAFIPDFIARKPIESGELVTLFNDYIPTDRGIYAVYPHRRYLPAKVRIFVDYLHNWFKKHP